MQFCLKKKPIDQSTKISIPLIQSVSWRYILTAASRLVHTLYHLAG